MDAKALAALEDRVRKARRFEKAIDGRVFKLCVPDPFAERKVFLSAEGKGDAGVQEVMLHLVLAALYAWEGVTYEDLLRDGDDSLLLFDPAVAKLLLQERLDWLDELSNELGMRRQAEQNRREDAVKN